MAVGNHGNMMSDCIEVKATADAASDGAFAMLVEPLEQVSAVSSVPTALAPKDPGSEWMAFTRFAH